MDKPKKLESLHKAGKAQLVIGLILGIAFGFLLQRGGVTRYDVIIGQLLLRDFTVVKIMLTAVVVGTVGVHLLCTCGLAELHPKPGSVGSSVLGGLLFGVGFGVLGYCPGTVAGACAQGSLDALFGGVVGILLGAGLFAGLYPRLEGAILAKGDFGDVTLPRALKVNHWVVVIPVVAVLVGLLLWIEKAGL
jgi:hypothetical protein